MTPSFSHKDVSNEIATENTGPGRMTPRALPAIGRAAVSAAVATRLQEKLLEFVAAHDNMPAEDLARSFVAYNPDLVVKYMRLLVVDLVRQRTLWPSI
jgi:hypothetical protein